jgi:hypothetical protein
MAIGRETRPQRRQSRRVRTWLLAGMLVVATVPGVDGSDQQVDLALVLGIDCSFSVDEFEFELQMRGTAEALMSPLVLSAIDEGPNRRIAVTVVQWSSSRSQEVVAPWTVIAGEDDAARLAATIIATPRRSNDKTTSISSYIEFGTRAITRARPPALRAAIDVASDGLNNNGIPVELARDRALAAGITINGLAILDGTWWLADYFRDHVTGGPGSFVLMVETYDSFTEAIRRKLEREIRGAGIS